MLLEPLPPHLPPKKGKGRTADKKLDGFLCYHVAVTQNTSRCFCRLISLLGTARTQIAIIINRLNAAEPTIVFGPKSPASKPLPIT